MNIFDNGNIPMLNKALNAYSMRQKVISSNIANITTFGYRSKNVTFEQELSGATEKNNLGMMTTNAGHLGTGGPMVNNAGLAVVEKPVNGTMNDDPNASGINNVDIDFEMAELAKNQIRFKYAARFITNSFRGLQKSIKGTV